AAGPRAVTTGDPRTGGARRPPTEPGGPQQTGVAPGWRTAGAEPIQLDNVELLSYRHELDVRHAMLVRELRIRDRAGRESTLHSRRFVSMARMHQAGMAWVLTPHNWSGTVEVISALDGRVSNHGVARYRQLEGRHLDSGAVRTSGADVIALRARTRQSAIGIAEAARTRVHGEHGELEVARTVYQVEDYIQQILEFDVREGTPVRVEKMVALYTSRDRAISEPLHNAEKSVRRY